MRRYYSLLPNPDLGETYFINHYKQDPETGELTRDTIADGIPKIMFASLSKGINEVNEAITSCDHAENCLFELIKNAGWAPK